MREYNRPPTLEELRHAAGGDLELVHGFDSIAYAGIILHCVAFCDEHGKLEQRPLNELATSLWAQALRRQGMELIDDKTLKPVDWLVGPVAVLFGDKEFMSEL